MSRPPGQLLGLLTGLALLAACAPAPTPSPAAAPRAAEPSAAQSAAPTQPSAGRPAVQASQPVSPRATVRFGGIGGSLDRAIFVGQEKGFFDEQGLDLELQVLRSSVDLVPLLATDKLDAAHGGSNAGFFNALASGVGVKVVSDVTISRPPGPGIKNSLWLVIRKDLAEQVKSVSDLKGRKVAVNNFGSVAQLQLEKTLEYHGMKFSDVEVEQVAFQDQVTALGNKAVDAAMMIDPTVTQAESRGLGVPLFEVAYALPNHTAQWLFYGPEFVKSQPEVGKRFMLAYVKSLRYMEDAWRKGTNRDEVIGFFIKHTPLKEPGLYQRMGISYSETNGNVNLQAIEMDQEFFLRQGSLKQKADPRTVVDTSFSQHAVQVLGRHAD